MEGYAAHWGAPSAGVTDIQVRSDQRRLGLAKFLMTQLLRLSDEFYTPRLIARVVVVIPWLATGVWIVRAGFKKVDLSKPPAAQPLTSRRDPQ